MSKTDDAASTDLINDACPGQSIKAITVLSIVSVEKPRSIVLALKLEVLACLSNAAVEPIVDNAFAKVVLPQSTCPRIPTFNEFSVASLFYCTLLNCYITNRQYTTLY